MRPAKQLRNLAAVGVSMVALVAGWWLLVVVFQLPEYLIPAPSIVLREFLSDVPGYLEHVGTTIIEATAGFLLGGMLAFIAGIVLFRFVAAQRLLLPWVTALQAIPIVAIAPLLIVWLGSGVSSKIAMSAIIAAFPILAAVLNGFSEVDQDAKQLFQSYRVGYWATTRHLLLPAALPALVTGMKVSAGLAVVGAIVAEMSGADRGLGHVLLNASYRLNTPRLFVAIALSGTLGYLGYSLPGVFQKLFPYHWQSNRGGILS